jgi:hypothetical protein
VTSELGALGRNVLRLPICHAEVSNKDTFRGRDSPPSSPLEEAALAAPIRSASCRGEQEAAFRRLTLHCRLRPTAHGGVVFWLVGRAVEWSIRRRRRRLHR